MDNKTIGSVISSAPRFCGITSFMRLPHTRDLNEVDVAIIGIPFDSDGAFRIGSRFAPESIRSQGKLCLRNYHIAHNIAPLEHIKVVDFGDSAVIPGSVERTYEVVECEVSPIFQEGVIPIALGGDHSISLPLLRAAAKKYGKVALVHFDAHLDTGDVYYDEIKYTHGTQFRRAVEEGLVDTSKSIQVGMNGTIYPEMTREYSETLGYKIITMDEAAALGSQMVANAILERTQGLPVFFSFDIDIMDVSVAPGSGAPEVGGYLTREMLQILRALRDLNIIGVDIVEVNPLFDSGQITSILAANIVFEFLAMIATRKRQRQPM
ncbi:agmatinase [Geobacter sp. SVR]|uniref:agmatinase n=1 Tax=Geobacter sp. SVR TaxID=2495594 RepID=UPI00143EF5A4|nr:agmatinase [Geobacter sp. SVR]BCS54414.1 agmatinase [Geobacter sp. SVR]GCF87645.1 agmatinase [Geobacter sp. SVR]